MMAAERFPLWRSWLLHLRASLRQLKPLEAVQRFLDAALKILARAALRAVADPIPFLQQQFSASAIGLEIERGDDVVADQHRQREIAEHPLLPRHVGLEAMLVAEEKMGTLALNAERIERREDVHRFKRFTCGVLQRLGPR